MDKPKLIDTLGRLIHRIEQCDTQITDCTVDIKWGETIKNKQRIPDPSKRKVVISLDMEDK